MSTSFAQFGLSPSLVETLANHKLTEPFPIQAEAIPAALQGRDIQGKAPTGSGKTLAFGLPLLTRVARANRSRPRALILAPTRELASQIETSLRPLAKAVGRSVFPVYGGVGYGPQKAALRKGVDVLVATPGRLEDLIEQRCLDLGDVDIVVVDEADRMADMGFMPAVRRILTATSSDRQTMLFSATLDGDIAVLSRDFQTDPVRVESQGLSEANSDATHHFWRVKHEERVGHSADVIKATGKSIVFTRTRRGADRLAKQLAREDVTAVAMHGGRSQSQRERALRAFSTGKAQALIATDVAARGIHVDNVATVIHFDVAGDHKDYQHRSGRTARAGARGTVVSLVMSGQEREIRKMQRQLDIDAAIENPSTAHIALLEKAPAAAIGRSPRPRDDSERPTNGSFSLYVGNLPWAAKPNDVSALFATHGKVKEVTLISDRRTGRSKGYGFVEMTGNNPSAVIEQVRGASLGGRTLKIRTAT